jgi:hypothetical protein
LAHESPNDADLARLISLWHDLTAAGRLLLVTTAQPLAGELPKKRATRKH